MECNTNEGKLKKRYDLDCAAHGCGYWSVCFEHGHSCPCSPDAEVSKGFSASVWESLQREMNRESEAAE